MIFTQCDQVNFRHFGYFLKRLAIFCEGLFRYGQHFEPTMAVFNAMGQIFNVVNEQIIWSHCFHLKLG